MARLRVERLADWHRIKGHHPIGSTVSAVVVRKVGLGVLCELDRARYPGVMRWRELSWSPAEQSEEGVQVGDTFQAMVIGYDDSHRDLILSRKAAQPGPFEEFVARFGVGAVVDGTVAQILQHEFLLALDGAVEGHLPKSLVPSPRAGAEKEVVGIGELVLGDTVRTLICSIDQEHKRIVVDAKAWLAQQEAKYAARAAAVRGQEGSALVLDDEGATGRTIRMVADEKLNVLVVEDTEDVATSVSWAVQRRKHRVDIARSVRQADHLIRHGRVVDVALVDLNLNGDSFTAVREMLENLRKQHPGARVYAFTANPRDLPEIQERNLVDGVLLKPVDAGEIIAYVEDRIVPPVAHRVWAMNEVVDSVLGASSRDEKGSGRQPKGEIMAAHLSAVCSAWPGARAAVLSYNRPAGQVTCLCAMGIRNGYFQTWESKLPLSPFADALADGREISRTVNLNWEGEDETLRGVMGPLNAWRVLGFPLRVESRREPMALFVFGPPHEDKIAPEKQAELRNIAADLALAMERALIDLGLAGQQRAICVGSLILGMTHELRNAVQALLTDAARLGLALEDRLSPSQAEANRAGLEAKAALGGIVRQVEALRQNLNTFLGVARMEEAGMKPLDTILSEVVDACKGLATHANVVIDLKTPTGCSMPVLPHMARQAFFNIVQNAIYHTGAARTDNGVVTVSVRRDSDGERPTVEIRVADNAWGMHEADRDAVFDMFFTKRTNGCGLGLYVTRLIVESLGGEVFIEETRKFGGSVFLVRLPIASCQEEPANAKRKPN